MERIKRSIVDRFMSHLVMKGECWEWRGEMTAGGGKFWICRDTKGLGRGRSMLAHRFAWEMWTGMKLDLKDVVERTCGNVRCCKKEHLRLRGMGEIKQEDIEKTIDAMLKEMEKKAKEKSLVKGFSSNIFDNGMKRMWEGEFDEMVDKWGEPKWTGEVITKTYKDYYFLFNPEKNVDIRGRKRVFFTGAVVEWWKF